MSVVGIDFGNLSVLIGQAGRGGVDVILNDSSNRQTATCVSIQGKQRFIGDSGAAMARSNVTNTFSCMKLLVGRKFDSPEVQKELKRAPFKASKMANGSVGINVLYNNEETVVPVEHVMAMMLVKAKDVARCANGNVGIADAVMAVPHWFTDAQKRGVLHACEIADLNCLKVRVCACGCGCVGVGERVCLAGDRRSRGLLLPASCLLWPAADACCCGQWSVP